MVINNVHCFFEQSGTFKNEFKKLGYNAFDYDILNDYNETDFVIDLFKQIELCYYGSDSIFDNICSEDLIIAFFPCVRFEGQILLWFQGNENNLRFKSNLQKLEIDLKLHKELHDYYTLLTMLCIICYRKNIKLIIENPYSEQHYLKRYWCLKPTLIDYNRRIRGDYYKKPTQYWFINCVPSNNFIFEGIDIPPKMLVNEQNTVTRSIISPIYANRFIREFIL